MKFAILFFVTFFAGCAGVFGGKDEATADFEKETSANEARVKEDRVRSSLAQLEARMADYTKAEKKIPEKLEKLVPKYLAEIPALDLPVCGRESSRVETYRADILRDGQVDGSRIRGTGRWGYVFNDHQIVIFVDCLKPSLRGVPWYQERGVY
ncbi:MAG: hypothetical protein M0D55_14830 [Elusimicrobiota bacterium]|nr:MAG: hypothetical protein M0D55_14830 [Elusimicrobiota bacterium]